MSGGAPVADMMQGPGCQCTVCVSESMETLAQLQLAPTTPGQTNKLLSHWRVHKDIRKLRTAAHETELKREDAARKVRLAPYIARIAAIHQNPKPTTPNETAMDMGGSKDVKDTAAGAPTAAHPKKVVATTVAAKQEVVTTVAAKQEVVTTVAAKEVGAVVAVGGGAGALSGGQHKGVIVPMAVGASKYAASGMQHGDGVDMMVKDAKSSEASEIWMDSWPDGLSPGHAVRFHDDVRALLSLPPGNRFASWYSLPCHFGAIRSHFGCDSLLVS